MNIKIYDLFGRELTNNSSNFDYNYIIVDILSPEYIDIILTSINQYNGTYIYKYECSNEFKNYCNKYGLNIDNYIKLGDYIIYDINDIKIILANKNNVLITDRYILIDTIGQLSIWKPHSINKEYTNFGVICTTNANEIPMQPIGLINEKFVKIFESNINDLFQNDYCVLGNKLNGKRKLLTTHMLNYNTKNNEKNNEKIKIKEKSIKNKWNKYKNNIVMLKTSDNPWYNNFDSISFNIINKDYIKKKVNKYKKESLFKKESLNNKSIDNNTIVEKNTDKSTYFILILFILIIILFLYNKYQKKK